MVELWQMAPSPPCRAVLLTAKAIGVETKITELDLMKGILTLRAHGMDIFNQCITSQFDC